MGNGTAIALESPAFADAPVNKALTPEQKIEFLREMYRIRRFEQVANKYYQQGKMGGFLHPLYRAGIGRRGYHLAACGE